MVKGFAAALSLGLIGSVAVGGAASAAVIFQDNFNSYYGYNPAFTNKQPGTNLTVQAGGSVQGWANSTSYNALNALDRGNGDYAIMFYDTTVMYYATPLAANDLNTTYTVSFQGSMATYSDATQVTQAGDYVQFLLKDSTGTVASYNYSPSTMTTAFNPGSFTYTGTGTGPVYLVIQDDPAANGRFGGAIDNVMITSAVRSDSVDPTAVPEPASMLLLAAGAIGAVSLRRKRNTV